MEFDEFQEFTRETAIYPGAGDGELAYPVLGLVGEAGEIAQKLKKLIRDKGGRRDYEFDSVLFDELGDVLWYVARITDEVGSSLDEVARRNVRKLRDRMERGVVRGEGDRR